jgi:ADP-heptose:LPS heptosyltransferase
VRQLLDLLELAIGAPVVPDGSLSLPPEVSELAADLLPDGPVYVAQAVGAGSRYKAWPLEHHIALARRLLDRGVIPAMILGPAEEDLRAELTAALPGARFPRQDALAAGHPAGPALTIALARRCAAAVAGDCGGGHMLAASGTRMVSLFGPTNPGKFTPWAAELTVLKAATMQEITVDAVLAALKLNGE